MNEEIYKPAEPEEDLFKIALKDKIKIEENSPHSIRLNDSGSIYFLDGLTPVVSQVLQLLGEKRFSKNELAEKVFSQDGYSGLSLFIYYIEKLERAGFVIYLLFVRQMPVCMYEDMTAKPVNFKKIDPRGTRFRLSKFSFIRLENGSFILESSLSPARLTMYDNSILNIIGLLSEFRAIGDWEKDTAYGRELLYGFMAALHVGDYLDYQPATAHDAAMEEMWSFHDLLFHTRTRYGRHNYNLGGTYRFLGKTPPKRALRKIESSLREIPLPVPAVTELGNSVSLNNCIEKRTSCRNFETLTSVDLGHFLHRCLRIKHATALKLQHSTDGQAEEMEILSAPYPSGGGIYELSFYLTVHACEGLECGFYHYNAFEHTLSLLQRKNKYTEAMLWYAMACTGSSDVPPVLITFSADFERMFWKYENMAYAAILKNTGAVFQTMYLVATDMNLGGCALGNGNIEILKGLTGKSLLRESSVGEFILGKPLSVS